MNPRIPLLSSTLLLALTSGCGGLVPDAETTESFTSHQDPRAPGGQDPEAPEVQDPPAEKVTPKKKKAEADSGPTRAERILAKQREVEEAERKLAYAKVEVTLAELKTESDLTDAERAVQGAERGLARAEQALVGFETALEAGRLAAQLEVARAENSLTVARADLAGILDIYAEEREARAKSEIVRRHEATVRFAQQRLAVAGLESKKKVEHDLPREQDELRWEVDKAKAAIKKARGGLARAQLAGELELTRARDAEVAAKHRLSDLKRVHKRLKASGTKRAAKNSK